MPGVPRAAGERADDADLRPPAVLPLLHDAHRAPAGLPAAGNLAAPAAAHSCAQAVQRLPVISGGAVHMHAGRCNCDIVASLLNPDYDSIQTPNLVVQCPMEATNDICSSSQLHNCSTILDICSSPITCDWWRPQKHCRECSCRCLDVSSSSLLMRRVQAASRQCWACAPGLFCRCNPHA